MVEHCKCEHCGHECICEKSLSCDQHCLGGKSCVCHEDEKHFCNNCKKEYICVKTQVHRKDCKCPIVNLEKDL